MHDQVGKSEFENSDEDQIMQENDFDYSSVRDRSRFPRERNTRESKIIPKMKQSQEEVQDLLKAKDPNVSERCSDTGKLICQICMSVRESLYKSLTGNNWEACPTLASCRGLSADCLISIPDG